METSKTGFLTARHIFHGLPYCIPDLAISKLSPANSWLYTLRSICWDIANCSWLVTGDGAIGSHSNRSLFNLQFNIYGKCSYISNTLPFLFSKIIMAIRAGIHKILLRIPNREDPDQSASSEEVKKQSDLVLSCLSKPFFFGGGGVVFEILQCLPHAIVLFVSFDSLHPINNLSVKQGRIFLG